MTLKNMVAEPLPRLPTASIDLIQRSVYPGHIVTPLITEGSSPKTNVGGGCADRHHELRMQPRMAEELSGEWVGFRTCARTCVHVCYQSLKRSN